MINTSPENKPLPKLPKGQMRCNRCRKPTVLRDGIWRDFKNQQIFLCVACNAAAAAEVAAPLPVSRAGRASPAR